jgi:L-ascorbate metabolism protein UlaG (beta-lactamase superfamily)
MGQTFRETWRAPLRALSVCVALCAAAAGTHAATPDHVDVTWLSIANIHLDFGGTRVLADGYITRVPQSNFQGGGGFDRTLRPVRPDAAAVREVFDAIGGRDAIKLLLTGHSHFDHSLDTPVWAQLSGANVVGANSTCLQLQAARLPAARCRAVLGGERIELGERLRMHVIRWNHSGDPATNPAQHNPRELTAVPVPDAEGGLRVGVAEDFPNGGGNRAYLFVVDTAQGPLSLLYQDSASAVDLTVPIVMDGRDHGAPLENLRRALAAAQLTGVDLWIATGGRDVAALVLPVLRPKAYLPVHWDGLFGAFKAGVPGPFSDPELEKLLADSGVRLVKPAQYMDKWRLDRAGITSVDNSRVKKTLGLH